MTKPEWYEIVTEMQARWPNKVIEQESVEVWYTDLAELPGDQVRAAMRSLYLDGREWAPNGGQIYARLVQLNKADPDHGEAWRLVNEALWKFAPYEWTKFYESLPPLVAEAARRYNFETQGGYNNDEESTVRAQFREIYKAVVAGQEAEDRHQGIPPAGLERLEQGQPRRIGDAVRGVLPKSSKGDDDDDR